MGPEEFDAEVDRIAAIADDEARMIAAHELTRALGRAEARLSDIRHFAAKALRERDRRYWTYDRIAAVLKIAGGTRRANVQRIVQGRRSLRDTGGGTRGAGGAK